MSFQEIINWFYHPSPDIGSGISHGRLCGYGLPNFWHACPDVDKLAETMYDAGLNLTLIEVDSATVDPWNRMSRYIKAMRKYGIWTIVCGNWNSNEFANATESWFQNIESFLRNDIGPEFLGTEISEWADARNNGWGMARKAENWAYRMAACSPYLRVWNKGSRPSSAPVGWLSDYHIAKHRSWGPSGCLVNGDHSDWLRWAANGPRESLVFVPQRVRESCRGALNIGRHYLLYGFAHCMGGVQPDYASIVVMGEEFKGVK